MRLRENTFFDDAECQFIPGTVTGRPTVPGMNNNHFIGGTVLP